MDIKKLKNFIAFKLPFGNTGRPPKTLKGTLKEVRVFDKATSEPACPICGFSLEAVRNQLQQSPDTGSAFTRIGSLDSSRTDIIKPYPANWWCSTCGTHLVFNEDPKKDTNQLTDEIRDS